MVLLIWHFRVKAHFRHAITAEWHMDDNRPLEILKSLMNDSLLNRRCEDVPKRQQQRAFHQHIILISTSNDFLLPLTKRLINCGSPQYMHSEHMVSIIYGTWETLFGANGRVLDATHSQRDPADMSTDVCRCWEEMKYFQTAVELGHQ